MPNSGRHEPEINLETGDLNIGNVDVLSLPVGTAAMAGSTPVTIATDDLQAKINSGVAMVNTGQLLTSTAAATYTYEVLVVAGATYRVTAINGLLYLGIEAGSDPLDRLWIIPAGDTQIITIPSGTALFYCSDAALVYGRLARIA